MIRGWRGLVDVREGVQTKMKKSGKKEWRKGSVMAVAVVGGYNSGRLS